MDEQNASPKPTEPVQPLAHGVIQGLAALMTILSLLWNIDVPEWLGFAWLPEQFYAVVLGLGLAVLFLYYRLDRLEGGRVPWFDALIACTSLVVLLYVGLNFHDLQENGFSNSTAEVIALGAVITILIVEGLRRSSGYVMLAVVGLFLLYAPLGYLVPGQFQSPKVEVWKLFSNLGFNPNAIFGIPLQVGTSIVIMFILFGQVLMRAGGGHFFTDLAMASMGRRRGGAAKIAVVGSALMGTISGSAVSNVVTTGIITIPLMRKAGYSALHAGAIEAVASTGGQLMPPVMGAAAFLMAEFLELPYAQIVIAAILPSLLYYFAVFVQVDLIAGREGIAKLTDTLPRFWKVLRQGAHFVIPFVVLVYDLFELNMPAEKAAVYASGSMLVLAMFIPYNGQRIRLSDLFPILAESGMIVVSLLMVVASAGIVIGILNLTGFAFALTNWLGELASGNVWIVLVIGALTCIILGMGMPTAAAYILLAALIAPVIQDHIGSRIDDPVVAGICAHMFVLYFGMMSMITPPIALSAFAAATLTKADPMTTGFVSMRLGWVAFVIPFLFVLSPTLMLFGAPLAIAMNFVTAAVGVYLISVAMEGYFTRRIGWIARTILMISGLAALLPDPALGFRGIVDAAGVVVGLAVLAIEFVRTRAMR